MKTRLVLTPAAAIFFPFLIMYFLASGLSPAQKIETAGGVRVVHNTKGGEWGNNPSISINLIRTIGDINTSDENLAFNGPDDMAVDDAGNIYILDSRNHRIQKFSAEAKYLATFGRRGQGPAEFNYPQSIDLEAQGHIYVLDGYQKRIQVLTPEGKEYKTILITKLNLDRMRLMKSGSLAVKGYLSLGLPGEKSADKTLPKLAKILDQEGNTRKEFGELTDFGNDMTNSLGNSFQLATDKQDNIYLTFLFQNRIEKYSPEGGIIWKAARELNYTTEVLAKGKTESKKEKGGGISVSYETPRMNLCSSGIAVDEKSRVWVATLNRQIKKEEEVMTLMVGGRDGISSIKTQGNVDLQTTDMYKLEVYGPDGVLLGEIPLSHFVDGLFIWKDKLFLLDRDRGAKFYEYQITEK
jgi:hypothetical protein